MNKLQPGGPFTDAFITHRGKKQAVHRCVVARYSTFFECAFNNGMKVRAEVFPFSLRQDSHDPRRPRLEKSSSTMRRSPSTLQC